MLRNSYIENYNPKSSKAKFMEREIALFHTDLNKIINSQRPITAKSIQRLPKKSFPIFIDDIMCNNEVNTLLYSTNAKKEIKFYLKQKNSLLNHHLNPQSPKKNKLSPLGEIMLKRSNIQIVKSLKEKIRQFLQKRNQKFEKYKNKLETFEKNQPNLEIKLKRLYYKPVNEIRLEGFRRAYMKCLKKSKSEELFELPNIQFNMEDVYSRLANNVILSQKSLREKINKEKEKKEKEQEEKNNSYSLIRQNQINHLQQIPNKKFQNMKNNSHSSNRLKKNIIIKNKNDKLSNSEHKFSDININLNNFEYYYNLKNMPKLNISKILKFSSGKEFKIKITPGIKKKCLSVLSCGPKPRIKKINLTSEKKTEENEEEIDYKEIRNQSIFGISKNFSKKNINNLKLYNTLMVDKNNRGYNVLRVRYYRDENLNSNLHIAVLNDSIKLVKYFLDKKLDPNGVNKEGKTPLHLAMELGNIKIIELLIKNGCDTEFKDKKGKIPMDYASKETKHYFMFESQ